MLIVLHIYSIKYIKRRAIRFANFEAISRFTGEKIISKNYITLILRVLTLIFLILAISGMMLLYKGFTSNSDFVLAIDASGSMLAEDYEPNRMNAAKDAAILFVDSIPEESMIGVLSFAGISFVIEPLTNNKEDVRASIETIRVDTIGGTAIGDALITSSNTLSESTRSKSIIILTDGQNNVGVSVAEAVDYAIGKGIMINTIGIGTEEGGVFQNMTFVSKLDTESMEYISNMTGGTFYRADNTTMLRDIFLEIAGSHEQIIKFDASTTLLLISLLFFFVEWLLTNTKYKTLP